MKNEKDLLETFKTSGLNELISALENRLQIYNNNYNKLAKKIELLELAIDFNSTIYLQAGGAISAAPLIGEFRWKADDLSEYISGLDAVTYTNGVPTRWASSVAKNIKLVLPLERSKELTINIVFNIGINEKVLSSLSFYVNSKKIPANLVKKTDGYLFTSKLDILEKEANTVININFSEYVEGKDRHTVGLCSMEVV